MSQYPAFISQNNIGTLHSVMSGIAKGIQNPALNLQKEYSNMHHCMANPSLHGKPPDLLPLLRLGTQKTTELCRTAVISQQPELEF